MTPLPHPERPATGPRPLPQPPPEIPGYAIEAVIGRGTSGVVYRARQLAVDREVALKVLHAELSGKPGVVGRLQREARTTARLAHPHVVSAIDMGETEGRWWYAMELVDGPSLAHRLRHQGRLSPREALRLFIPLTEALEHLWEHGVVHRDIKPANVLIDRTGGARLADLGLAFAEDDPLLTLSDGTLGTPHYISPEQAVDPKGVDVQTDVWSLGATLFHAVCGEPPFSGASTAEVLSAVLYEPIPDPQELEPRLSKGLALVLRKCLTRDLRRRYATPTQLRDDLERVRERRPPLVRPRALDPVRREPRRRRAAVLAASVLAAAAAVLLLLQRGDGGAERTGAPDVHAAYAPLEDLARRARSAPPERLGALLLELDDLEAELPSEHERRWSGLRRELRLSLRSEVRDLRRELEADIEAALRARDLATAWELYEDGLDERLFERTGVRPEDLARERVSLEPWLSVTGERLSSTTAEAVRSVERALGAWRARLLQRVDRLVEAGSWGQALDLLEPGDEEMLRSAGVETRLPAPLLDEALASERVTLTLRRQRLVDDWLLVDGALRGLVRERADALAAELLSAPSAFDAAARLRAAFAEELERRGLGPEPPPGLPSTAHDELERRAAELARRRAQRAEALARREVAELAEHAASLAERREYGDLLALWEEAAVGLAAAEGEGPWKSELAREIDLRQREARLLRDLLRRTADRVRELVGRPVDLRIGGVLYPEARIEAGADPLVEGFRVEGRPGRIDLHTVGPATFESLAGLASPEELAPGERLLLALFRGAEGDPRGAREALRSGPLPEDAGERALARALEGRVEASLERRRDTLSQRASEARRLLDLVLEPGRVEHTPVSVSVRLERLLEDYGDVEEVRARREELEALRERLGPTGADAAASFRRSFAPTALAFPGGERVRLVWDFVGVTPRVFETGEWTLDGRGLALAGEALGEGGTEELARQHGVRLALRAPLEPDRGTFEAALRFEEVETGGAFLLAVSAAGFHVVLAGAGAAPGGERGPLWLAGTGRLEVLLERLRAGEGDPLPFVADREQPHELVLRADRPAGRLDVEVDGNALGPVQASPPGPGTRTLAVRAGFPLRLLRLALEADA